MHRTPPKAKAKGDPPPVNPNLAVKASRRQLHNPNTFTSNLTDPLPPSKTPTPTGSSALPKTPINPEVPVHQDLSSIHETVGAQFNLIMAKLNESPEADEVEKSDQTDHDNPDLHPFNVLKKDLFTKTDLLLLKLNEGKSLTKANKSAITDIVSDIRETLTKFSLGPDRPFTVMDQTSLLSTIKETIKEEVLNIIKDVLPDIVRTTVKAVLSQIPSPPTPVAHIPIAPTHTIPLISDLSSKQAPHLLKPPTFKPAIIVSHKQSTNTTETLSAWQKSITFKDTNFAPVSAKPVSNNKIRIEFLKPEHVKIALQKTESSPDFQAEPSRKLEPMVIVKGIADSNPPDTLADTISKQNDCIAMHTKNPNDFQFKFKRPNNMNGNLYNAVFTTTPTIWRSIKDAGKVNIDYQRVHVEEYVPVLQCFQCLQYGHTKKWCKKTTTTICSHCSENTHNFKNCPDKDDPSKIACFNCKSHCIKYNLSEIDIAHSATSTTCPKYINLYKVVRSRTDYGE